MGFSDNFFKKVEKKTNVNKETILSLAKKIEGNNLKNETALRDLVKEIGTLTGKSVSKEQEDKIVKAIVNDKVPKDIERMVQEKYKKIASLTSVFIYNNIYS